MPASLTSESLRKGFLELTLRRLKRAGDLSLAEEDAVRALSPTRRTVARGETLPSTSGALYFVLDGWGCQMRDLGGRRRQIFAFLLPGDVIGTPAENPTVDPYDCMALTHLTVVDAASLRGHAGIAAGIAAAHALAHSRLFDHVVRLGAHKAYEGVAHLLLELYTRSAEVGLADGPRFPFPIGQERLGETLGLSETHVNRTLARLRETGHVLAGGGWLALPRARELALEVGYPPSPVWAAPPVRRTP